MDWGRCILCQKDSSAPLLDPLVTGIIQFGDMSISKTTWKNFKEVKFMFPVGILVHLNELQKSDGIIQNLKEKQNGINIAH